MKLRRILMIDVGLIAAACLIPLVPVIAQNTGAEPVPPGEGRAQIMRIQQDLNENGFPVPVTGAMNAQTVAALRAYQRQHGLPPTGQPDGQTFTSLEGIAPPTIQEGSVLPAPPMLVVPVAPPGPPPG